MHAGHPVGVGRLRLGGAAVAAHVDRHRPVTSCGEGGELAVNRPSRRAGGCFVPPRRGGRGPHSAPPPRRGPDQSPRSPPARARHYSSSGLSDATSRRSIVARRGTACDSRRTISFGRSAGRGWGRTGSAGALGPVPAQGDAVDPGVALRPPCGVEEGVGRPGAAVGLQRWPQPALEVHLCLTTRASTDVTGARAVVVTRRRWALPVPARPSSSRLARAADRAPV